MPSNLSILLLPAVFFAIAILYMIVKQFRALKQTQALQKLWRHKSVFASIERAQAIPHQLPWLKHRSSKEGGRRIRLTS
jgi:hypothetical protein